MWKNILKNVDFKLIEEFTNGRQKGEVIVSRLLYLSLFRIASGTS